MNDVRRWRRLARWGAALTVLALLLTREDVPMDPQPQPQPEDRPATRPRKISPEQQEAEERAIARHRARQAESARLGPAPKKPNLVNVTNLLPELKE